MVGIRMPKSNNERQISAQGDKEAIEHFKGAIASGKNWYIALLEAMGLWTSPEEVHKGRHYRYLIEGQAFDYLLLAERLCQEVDGLLPEQEVLDLISSGKPPLELPEEELKRLMGSCKYQAYLNYLYGVVVECALLRAVDEDIAKERRAYIYHDGHPWDSYQQIYGADQKALLRRFREEKGYPQGDSITLPELREFTYWLFKYRLKNCNKAKVASDTKKAMEHLRYLRGLKSHFP
jgi:hypothetical protein